MGVRFPRRSRVFIAGGVAATAIVTAGCFLLRDHLPPTVPALLLLVPIAVVSARASWRESLPVAIVAALAFSFAFLPPIGRLRTEVTEDLLVLATFTGVALTVGIVAGRRPDRTDEGLDSRRAVLLRSVSHDLRTPLGTIRSVSADLLDPARYDDDMRSELLGLVVDESDRLDRIVGNLLSISRVQAGALVPERSPESMADLIAHSARRLGRTNESRIETVVETGLPDVWLDPVQIDQVLTNLIENSMRFAPPDTSVRVEVARNGAHVVTTVSDDGPGFSADALVQLFTPFRSSSGSSGLGLSVCKAIVDAHGGTIDVVPGRTSGAAVRFTLPVGTGAGPASPRG